MSEIAQEEMPLLDIETILKADLMDVVDDDTLSKIGSYAKERFESDYQSNIDWRKEVEVIRKAAAQVSEAKTSPWENASNIKYPLITTAALQFNARAYPIIINDSNIALVKILGSDAGTPQEGPDGEQIMIGAGAKQERGDRVNRYMNYQLTEEMDEWDSEMDQLLLSLPIDGTAFKKTYWSDGPKSEFINALDLVVNADTKSLLSCPVISQIFSLYPYEIKERVLGELWVPVTAMTEDRKEPMDFVEQHSRYDLDGDGYPEPYIITFEKESGQVVSLRANFGLADVIEDMDKTLVKINSIPYFTDYHFLPDPEGKFYSRGFGQLLHPINNTVDSILNLLIDAGNLANTGGGFIAKGFRIRSGELRISPGKWHKVDVAGMPMKDAILPYPIKEPSSVLFSLLGTLLDAGKDIASIQDVMTGAAGQNTPATTVLSMIEQGMKVYTAIFRRVYRAERSELKKLYVLNSRYLQNADYVNILDEPADAKQDFDLASVDISPAADPNMATDMQKAAKAQVLKEYIGHPWINGQMIDMEAMKAQGIADPESYLLPPQGPSPEQQLEMGKLQLLSRKEDRNDDEQNRKWYETIAKAGVDTASILEKLAVTDEKGADNTLNMQEILFLQGIANDAIENEQQRLSKMERGQPMVLGVPNQ